MTILLRNFFSAGVSKLVIEECVEFAEVLDKLDFEPSIDSEGKT